MANPTTNFGWVMPTATDLVTDLPADFAVFGQGVDTSMAYLLGGTTGQILSKTSGTNMAFTWINNDQGDITGITATSPLTGGGSSGAITVGIQDATTSVKGSVQLSDSTSTTSSVLAATPTAVKSAYDLADGAIAKTTVTTAGDVIYRNATVPTRLGIGTAGQVLTVNSGATAPEWSTPTGSSGATFSAYGVSGNQNVTGATWTAVTLGSEAWDSDNCYSTSTYRFTPTTSGYYQFNWGIQCANTTLKAMWSSIYKNGTVYKYGVYTQMTTVSGDGITCGSALIYMNGSSDYVQMYGWVEGGGGTPRFYAGSVAETRFDGVWIRS